MYRTLCRFRRLLAALLSLALLAALLPASVLAGSDAPETKAAPVDITDKFTDANFLAQVYNYVNKEPGEPIYDTDTAAVKRLDVYEVKSVAGLEYFPNLTWLDVYFCNIKELDLRCCPNLERVFCRYSHLEKLNVSGLTKLTELRCNDNDLTELSVSSPVLYDLLCDNNQLTRLDVSGCTALECLTCQNNQLEELDVSGCPKLRVFGCSYNYMADTGAVKGYDALPKQTDDQHQIAFEPQKDERLIPRMDPATRDAICADYYASCQDPEFGPDDVHLSEYYGCMNGWYIVVMDLFGMTYPDDLLYLNVGGFQFKFPSHGYHSLFMAWKDGTCLRVTDAYAQGELSNQDVYDLFSVFYWSYDTPFKDVSPDAWYYRSVRDAYLCELFNGVSKKKFDPDGTMTRAMLVTVLWRMNGAVYVDKPCPFTDVPARSWYTEAVAWAAEKGIVNGVGGGKFAPNQPVTREQFVTILYRMSGAMDLSPELDGSTYVDSGKTSRWARPAMRWAVANKILTGIKEKEPGHAFAVEPYSDRYRLEPGAQATRAQAAALLIRYLSSSGAALSAVSAKSLSSGYQSLQSDAPAPVSDQGADRTADFILSAFKAACDPEQNTVLSPISLLYALGLLANGAAGETKDELEQVFGMGVTELNDTLRAIMANLPGQYGSVGVHLANSIWIRNGFAVKPQFLQDNADYLGADAFQASFDKGTVKDVNNWINRNTDGMIPRLIDELSPEAVLALVNAMYFRGTWSDPYLGSAREMPFHAADGSVQTAQMLSSTEYTFLHDEQAVGFIKPFKGHEYAFAVIVPNEGVSLEDYIAGLDGEHLRDMLVGESYDAVYATMPKFCAETKLDFADPLKSMGVSRIFDPLRADLSGISDGPLFVSNATHKAVIDVNETGVSAAAATVLEIWPGAAEEEDPKIATVTADRPYLYMIIDRRTNLPLFIGANVRMD